MCKLKKNILLPLLLLSSFIYAQEITLTGKIVDAKGGLPLSGATVTLRGTKKSIITSSDGSFTFKRLAKENTLLVTYTGYLQKEVTVKSGDTEIIISLEVNERTMDEVVVVGYGSQSRKSLTGAIGTVRGEDIQKLPTQRVDQALQGRVAGVSVVNTEGSPGGNTTIRIRGLNSINGNNGPLIVIDGAQGGDLNLLNPSDIESVDVLKDASATAIYGSRGANGVILVTTRLGKTAKPIVTYSLDHGIQNITKYLPVMTAGEFARFTNEVTLSGNGSGRNPQPKFTQQEIDEYDKNGGSDMQRAIFKTGIMNNHQLSISGGGDKLKYLVSGSLLDQSGILLKSRYKRASLRTNLTATINNWVKFGVNAYYVDDKYMSPPFGREATFLGHAINRAPLWPATERAYDDNGNYWVHRTGKGGNPNSVNPLISIYGVDVERPRSTYNGNVYLDIKIAKGLTFKPMLIASTQTSNQRNWYNELTWEGRSTNGLATINEFRNVFFQNSNILTYDRLFAGKHHLVVTGLAEQQTETTRGSGINASRFLVSQTGVDGLAGASQISLTSFYTQRLLNSYMGRVNYSFNNKYNLTATYRADGSSVFGKNNKWGYFPSIGASWQASEEKFLTSSKLISNLKIRGSYGITGNQAIQPYQTSARISGGSDYSWTGSDQSETGFFISSIANPNLKWESTAQTNLGMDIELLKGRLSATVDLYRKLTTDLLMSRRLPLYNGINSIIDNVGSIENKGIEVSLNVVPLTNKNFNWNTNFNLTINRNKVVNLGADDKLSYESVGGGYGLSDANFMFLIVGQPFGQMWGWKYDGVWKTGEEKEAALYGKLPGDEKFRDVDGDGTVNENDKMLIGNAFPKFTFGFNNTLKYKNLSLDFLFTGQQGNQLFNAARIQLESQSQGTSKALLNHWTPQNENTNIPGIIEERAREAANLTDKYYIPGNQTSRWIEDASYIRLKLVTMSYQVSSKLIDKIKIQNCRLFVSGTNLLTFTKYTGYDPEVSTYNSDVVTGVDFSSYPVSRIITFGISMSL